ncbi:MAG TPA: HAMP domain-containing sensor histidine kinase [Ktedonobacteraceae bacterium]
MKIRTRLTLQFIFIMTGILVVFSVTILLSTGFSLRNNVEGQMHETAVEMSTGITRSPGGFDHASPQELDRLAPLGTSVQVQDTHGAALVSSSNWKERNLPPSLTQNLIVTDQVQQVSVHNSDIYLYRHAVYMNNHLQGYVLLVSSAEISKLALGLLRGFLLPGVLLYIGLGGLLVWLLIRRATRPLEHLVATASEIAEASDHSLRVQPEGARDEINRLAYTINGMLQSLEEAYRQVQAVNELQRHFLADVSHELRTPLTIMLSSLDLIKKEGGTDPDFQDSALENIRVETERMARMVTQLLILARTDASATMAREPLLVVDIVADVCRQKRPADDKHSVEWSGLGLLEDAVVLGNADYLKQLFLILLENAFKYTPEGGKVEVIGALNEDMVAITVADTGIGIVESDLPRVFDRFYRSENARFRSGLGLGLSIAQSIGEQHGGKITVESTVGQGSRFTVTLPLLNRGVILGLGSEGEQANATEKIDLIGRV